MTEHETNFTVRADAAPSVGSPLSANRQSASEKAATRTPTGVSKRWAFPLAALILIVIALAWSRVGALGLPSTPRGITLESAGLANLQAYAQLDAYIRGQPTIDSARSNATPAMLTQYGLSAQTVEAAPLVRDGIELIHRGDEPAGLALMRDGVRRDPSNLVLGNAYRMAVFRLQRTFLQSAHERAMLVPAFPPHLDNEPIAFFESLAARGEQGFSLLKERSTESFSEPRPSGLADSEQGKVGTAHPTTSGSPDHSTHRASHPIASGSREVRLQLALAWVDKMLLFPALEIKAPSSVGAVDILTRLIDGEDPAYVPALFARGLNHLHRPARLVWPESENTPPDAAARDIGLCVAIGRRLGAGSDRLQATLAIALGDAYVKAGRYGVARSWWQIAQNLSGDDDLHQAIRRRYAWHDDEMIDRLEEELDRARSQLENPMTDLALMWN
jgi:hypothetical protein